MTSSASANGPTGDWSKSRVLRRLSCASGGVGAHTGIWHPGLHPGWRIVKPVPAGHSRQFRSRGSSEPCCAPRSSRTLARATVVRTGGRRPCNQRRSSGMGPLKPARCLLDECACSIQFVSSVADKPPLTTSRSPPDTWRARSCSTRMEHRYKAPPRLTRLTPDAFSSSNELGALDGPTTTLTGFGATAFTTACIASMSGSPGA